MQRTPLLLLFYGHNERLEMVVIVGEIDRRKVLDGGCQSLNAKFEEVWGQE
jgi:hypothetical protein